MFRGIALTAVALGLVAGPVAADSSSAAQSASAPTAVNTATSKTPELNTARSASAPPAAKLRKRGTKSGKRFKKFVTACESKSTGDKCSVETRRGKKDGVCTEVRNKKVACIPEGFKKGKRKGKAKRKHRKEAAERHTAEDPYI